MKRNADHDYSAVAWYHLVFYTHRRREVFASDNPAAMASNECVVVALDTIAPLSERYPCARVDTIRILPNQIDVLVNVIKHKNPSIIILKGKPGYKQYRRTMTIPLVSGYFMQQSANQINSLHRTHGQAVWKRRYSDRVLYDDEAVRQLRESLLKADPDAISARFDYRPELKMTVNIIGSTDSGEVMVLDEKAERNPALVPPVQLRAKSLDDESTGNTFAGYRTICFDYITKLSVNSNPSRCENSPEDCLTHSTARVIKPVRAFSTSAVFTKNAVRYFIGISRSTTSGFYWDTAENTNCTSLPWMTSRSQRVDITDPSKKCNADAPENEA